MRKLTNMRQREELEDEVSILPACSSDRKRHLMTISQIVVFTTAIGPVAETQCISLDGSFFEKDF